MSGRQLVVPFLIVAFVAVTPVMGEETAQIKGARALASGEIVDLKYGEPGQLLAFGLELEEKVAALLGVRDAKQNPKAN